jgi:hypothetical protein
MRPHMPAFEPQQARHWGAACGATPPGKEGGRWGLWCAAHRNAWRFKAGARHRPTRSTAPAGQLTDYTRACLSHTQPAAGVARYSAPGTRDIHPQAVPDTTLQAHAPRTHGHAADTCQHTCATHLAHPPCCYMHSRGCTQCLSVHLAALGACHMAHNNQTLRCLLLSCRPRPSRQWPWGRAGGGQLAASHGGCSRVRSRLQQLPAAVLQRKQKQL